MAAKDSEFDIDSFESVEADTEEQGRINLDPGENVVGTITDANLVAGDHGLIEIDGRTLWLNATMRTQLESALIEGQPVAHVKSEDTDSFEDEDGEEVEYHPRELQFMGD